ncbi:MAG: CvpA family protein, partial [Pseudomonadota bacterium]
GMIKGLIIATLFYLLVTLIYDSFYGSEEKRPDWLTDSRTYPLLNASGTAMVDLVEQQRGEQEAVE